MRTVFLSNLFAIIVISLVLTACADTLSDGSKENQIGKIGLPSTVNALNSDIMNAKSRSGVATIVPEIHTSLATGSGKPICCRYTTTPGITTKKNHNNIISSHITRGIAITNNNFYDSYCLYSYIYPSSMTWASTTYSSGTAYDKTNFGEEVKMAKSWMTDENWPGSKERCSFFAYAPYRPVGLSKFITNTWPSFHYSVPEGIAEQCDLLVTKNQISANANLYGNIDMPGDFNKPDSLRFDHACTAIRFAIGDKMAPGIIKKIRICNVYGAGDYNYQTESWSNVDSLKTFTLTQDFEIKPGEHNKILNNDDNVFMMIPQKVPMKGTIEVTINDGTDCVITDYIRNDEWKKGYTVTYYLSTAGTESSYVLSMAPDAGNVASSGGTKGVTIYSYKQTYYGSLIDVPWTASYTYDDADEIGTTVYSSSNAIISGFTASGNGSDIGEIANYQVASQVLRSKTWRSTHTQALRNAADGSCNLASGKQTANCYVVQAPGTYTFPLVYGNALNADGSSNGFSYGTSTFVDHNGVQINDPYIYATNGGKNTPYDACILWQDAPSLVTPSSVQLTSDKHSIQFTVDRKNICQGNCVIGVRDKDQNIMWSWHIWVTDHSMTNTYAIDNNPSVGGAVTSNFMEVPLGWCDAETRIYDPRTFHLTVKQTDTGGQTATANIVQLSSDSTYTYGDNAPYYQWGRKDPLLPSNGMGSYDKPYYDNQIAAFKRNTGGATISTGILNPTTMYGSEGGWCSNNPELWNKGNTVYTCNNNTVYKTVYDPSPSYYSVPKTAAYTGFTTTGYNSDNYSEFNVFGSYNSGWNFYSQPNASGPCVFLKALGCRDGYATRNSVGTVSFTSYGHYLLSSLQNSTDPRYLGIKPGSVYPHGEHAQTSYGFNLWPTK